MPFIYHPNIDEFVLANLASEVNGKKSTARAEDLSSLNCSVLEVQVCVKLVIWVIKMVASVSLVVAGFGHLLLLSRAIVQVREMLEFHHEEGEHGGHSDGLKRKKQRN